MQKFQLAHWLRTHHLIPTEKKVWNLLQKVEIELIDSRQSTIKQNSGQERKSNNVLIQSLRKNAKNKNTQQRKQLTQSLASKNGYESMNRRSWVKFSSGFTQQFGKDYERDSFRVMVTAADWYLIEKEYK